METIRIQLLREDLFNRITEVCNGFLAGFGKEPKRLLVGWVTYLSLVEQFKILEDPNSSIGGRGLCRRRPSGGQEIAEIFIHGYVLEVIVDPDVEDRVTVSGQNQFAAHSQQVKRLIQEKWESQQAWRENEERKQQVKTLADKKVKKSGW